MKVELRDWRENSYVYAIVHLDKGEELEQLQSMLDYVGEREDYCWAVVLDALRDSGWDFEEVGKNDNTIVWL